MKLLDLSVAIQHQLPGDPPPQRPTITYMDHQVGAEQMLSFFPGITKADLPDGEGWAVEDVRLSTHSGTHMDAPYHYASVMDGDQPAATIDECPLEWCYHDGVVFDFTDKPDGYVVTPEDFQEKLGEMRYELKPFDIVLIRSGAAPYAGTDAYLVKGCGVGREGTTWLHEQGVKVVGTDAWSWDPPLSLTAEKFSQTHDSSIIWEGHFAGREFAYYQMEKLTNLDQLPDHGFQVICFPIKIQGASAGWTRAVAVLP
jgi:kynurenine formamidase